MIRKTKNLDMQSIQSPEGSENKPEAKAKIPPPAETVASLDSKILATDNKVSGYERGIEETSARLAEARAKLDLPPDTEEAPSIRQSRREVEKLEAQKVEFEERKTKLGGETYFAVKETTEETPTRMEDEQDYKMILERIETDQDAYKYNPGNDPRIFGIRARASFSRKFPDRAKVYEEAEILKLERDKEKTKNTQVLEQKQTEQPGVGQTLSNESEISAEPIAQDTTRDLVPKQSTQYEPVDEAFEKRRADFRIEKDKAEIVRDQAEEARRKMYSDVLKNLGVEPTGTDRQVEKKEFKAEIPRGWTTLKHGTNLMNWGENNPYASDKITLEKPLSVISQEDFEQDQQSGKQYDTTKTYASMPRPESMSDAEFEKRNKPFEMRVLFYQDHARSSTDPEYKQGLDKQTMDRIAKYYFANVQGGGHPLVPKGEILVKLGQVQENGQDVFYFVPENLADVYAKESGVEIKKPAEIPVVEMQHEETTQKEDWVTESRVVQAKLIETMREQFTSASPEQFQATLNRYMDETKKFNERMAETRTSTPEYKKPRVLESKQPLDTNNVSAEIKKPEIKNKLEQQPQTENITKENFERNRQQGKALMVNGQIWTISEARPDGSVFLRKDITIPEALELAEKANAGQLDRGFNIPQLNTPNVKTKGGMVTMGDLESGAKWVQKNDSQQDATTQREAEEIIILQARIASGEFENNNNGALDLLKDVLKTYLDRLQK